MTEKPPACRFCGTPLTHTFVDLGKTPLANSYVTPEDVGALIQPVLAHRLVLSPEAIAGGSTAEQILSEATRGVPVPQG